MRESPSADTLVAHNNSGRHAVEKILTQCRNHRLLLLAFLYIAYQFSNILFGSAGLFERDGYYHARFANLLPSFGLSRQFEWTQFSTWNEHFCDKEFLFHLLMVPFTLNRDEPILGALVFALILACGVFVTLYVVLRKNDVRWPLLFALLPLCLSAPFLSRVLMLRSHVLSIMLLLISLHFLIHSRWKAVFVMGFIYAWSYTFPLLLVMTAVPLSLGRKLGGGPLDWKSPLAATLGVLLGLTLHPYSPETLETFLTLLQIIGLGTQQNATQMEVGNELYAMPVVEMLRLMPLYCLLSISVWASAVVAFKRLTPATKGLLGATIFWQIMTFKFGRFVEYSVPLLALAAGWVVRDLWGKADFTLLLPRYNKRMAAGLLVLSLLLCGGHILSMDNVYAVHRNTDPPRFRGAAQWMSRNLKPGETVAHIWWEEFPDLYYDAYRQHFIWGIDPTFTLRYDKEAALILEDMRCHRKLLNPHWLRDILKARVLVMGHANALQFLELTCTDWHPVYVDRSSVIFALEGPNGPPEQLQLLPRERPLSAFPPTNLPLTGKSR